MREAIPYYCLKDTSELQYYLSADDAKPTARAELISSGLGENALSRSEEHTSEL